MKARINGFSRLGFTFGLQVLISLIFTGSPSALRAARRESRESLVVAVFD